MLSKFRHTNTIVNYRNQQVKNLKVFISEEVLFNLNIFNYLNKQRLEIWDFNVLAVRVRKTLIEEEEGILNETVERIASNFIHHHSPQDCVNLAVKVRVR